MSADILAACEEMVQRFAHDKTLRPETRAEIEADPVAGAKKLQKALNVGPLRRNAATCKVCGCLIVSISRHDFETCHCGRVSVDGGTWYARRGGPDGREDIIEYWPWEEV